MSRLFLVNLSTPKNKKKDEPEFKEIAKGKVYNFEFSDKNFTWIDLRSEEQKEIGVSEKNLGVKHSKGVKYDQLILVPDEYFHDATPYEIWLEIDKLKKIVETRSGSMDIGVMYGNRITLDSLSKCKECETPLFIKGRGFNCPKCGKSTV
jgi:hypothetical protein